MYKAASAGGVGYADRCDGARAVARSPKGLVLRGEEWSDASGQSPLAWTSRERWTEAESFRRGVHGSVAGVGFEETRPESFYEV